MINFSISSGSNIKSIILAILSIIFLLFFEFGPSSSNSSPSCSRTFETWLNCELYGTSIPILLFGYFAFNPFTNFTVLLTSSSKVLYHNAFIWYLSGSGFSLYPCPFSTVFISISWSASLHSIWDKSLHTNWTKLFANSNISAELLFDIFIS